MSPPLLLLLFIPLISGCSLQNSVSCKDERIERKSTAQSNFTWNINPFLSVDYDYSRSEKGLRIELKASWRLNRETPLVVPLKGFELILNDLSNDTIVEIRHATISIPENGLTQLSETIDFYTVFKESLEFGHSYEVELQPLPLGNNNAHRVRLSVPKMTKGCEKGSEIALDNVRYKLSFNVKKRFGVTSSVYFESYLAPLAFCLPGYKFEILDSANSRNVYGSLDVPSTDDFQHVTHQFYHLPIGVYIKLKVSILEPRHIYFHQCACRDCLCRSLQTAPFMFAPIEMTNNTLSPPSLPQKLTTPDQSFNPLILLIIPVLFLVIGLSTVIILLLKRNFKNPLEKIQLISHWDSTDSKSLIEPGDKKENAKIWVIGLPSHLEREFLTSLSSHLSPTAQVIFGPADLHDGDNRWQWIAKINGHADLILLLFTSPSSSLLSSPSSLSDPFSSLFIDCISCLHPADNRLLTVALDECSPVLFQSNEIIYRIPRDLPFLLQSIDRRGITVVTEDFAMVPTNEPANSDQLPTSADRISHESDESLREPSQDSGFMSNPPTPPVVRSETAKQDRISEPNGVIVEASH